MEWLVTKGRPAFDRFHIFTFSEVSDANSAPSSNFDELPCVAISSVGQLHHRTGTEEEQR